jgi:NDP-sugar pyrophosphorylase family protein
MLVMNGDLITQFDAGRMICQHEALGHCGTIGVQTYVHEVPFGVIEEDEGFVAGMREKPAVRFLINSGIYIIDSELRHRLEPGKPTAMPSILEDCLLQGERVGTFHVDEEWMDVGRHDELKKARGLA